LEEWSQQILAFGPNATWAETVELLTNYYYVGVAEQLKFCLAGMMATSVVILPSTAMDCW